MSDCVFTDCLIKLLKEKKHNAFREVLHTHSHTLYPSSVKQAETNRDHQVCVSILPCVFVPVMWSVVLRPINAARVPALLPFFSKWPSF